MDEIGQNSTEEPVNFRSLVPSTLVLDVDASLGVQSAGTTQVPGSLPILFLHGSRSDILHHLRKVYPKTPF